MSFVSVSKCVLSIHLSSITVECFLSSFHMSVCLHSRMNIYLFGLLCFRRLLLLLIGNGGGVACSIVEFVVSI